ncbi:predicted protein [Postia placenta Mad-698-R]|nr:predicted protein [Postia placenta Mad-698-R]
MNCDRTERIEQIFQRVEEESERRARAEAEAEARAAQEAQETQFSSIPVVTIQPAAQTPATSTSTSAVPGRRRGGSVSVSRFGQDVKHDMHDIMFAHDGSLASLTKPADAPPPVSSYVVHKQGFYQAQTHTTSADSLASLTPPDHADADTDADEDEEQVVLMETFAGRQSLSKAFSRRLSRSRSHSCDVFAAASSLVIGVRVEEATVEGEAHGAGVVVAVAGGDEGLREKDKEQDRDRDAGREKGRWIGKARELSQKLRRRSTVVFTGSPLASPTAVSTGPT